MHIDNENPMCTDPRSGCCSNNSGVCGCLSNAEFYGKCPFYKTSEELKEDLTKCTERLFKLGRYGDAAKNLGKLVRLA